MERQDQPQRLPHEDVDKLIYSTTSRRVAAPVKLCLLRYDRKPRKTAHAKERSNLISLFARAELSGIRRCKLQLDPEIWIRPVLNSKT